MQLDVVVARARPGLLPPGMVGVLKSSSDRKQLLAYVSLLRALGLAEVMAEPRLVTMSGRHASFLDGGVQAVPVLLGLGLGQIGVQFEEFGTRLNFLPTVLDNVKIHLEVEPEVCTPGPKGLGRNTQRSQWTVELDSGQTFVFGESSQCKVTVSTVK